MRTPCLLRGAVVLVLLVGVWFLAAVPTAYATCFGEDAPVSLIVEEIDSSVAFVITVPADQQHQDYAAVVKDVAHEFTLPHHDDSSIEAVTLPDKYLYHDGRLINLEDGIDAVVLVSSYIPAPCDFSAPFVFALIDPVSGTVKEGKEVERRTDLFSQGEPGTVDSILMDKLPEVLPQYTDLIPVTLRDPSSTSDRHRIFVENNTMIVGMGDTVYRITIKRKAQAIIWGSDGAVSRLYVGPERYNFRSRIKGTYSIGDRSEEVQWAQRLLNKGNCKVADSGPGSPGNESDYFGEKTRDALICFQREHSGVMCKRYPDRKREAWAWENKPGVLTPRAYEFLFSLKGSWWYQW